MSHSSFPRSMSLNSSLSSGIKSITIDTFFQMPWITNSIFQHSFLFHRCSFFFLANDSDVTFYVLAPWVHSYLFQNIVDYLRLTIFSFFFIFQQFQKDLFLTSSGTVLALTFSFVPAKWCFILVTPPQQLCNNPFIFLKAYV